MRSLFAAFLLGTALSVSLYAQVPFLEIHHIGAGDGDATLILAVDSTGTNLFTGNPIWDTCAVLIDGQREGGAGEIWRYVKDTLDARFPGRKTLDYMVVSHLHIDHYGGLAKVITNAVAANWKIKGVVTRRQLVYSAKGIDVIAGPDAIDTCYSDVKVSNPNGVKLKAFFKAVTTNAIKQLTVQPHNNLFDPNNFRNISMECIVAGGVTISGYDSLYTFLPATKQKLGNFGPKSENDLSYGWLLTFQGFHYVTLGDLGGKSGGNYVDGETPVTDYLVHRFDDADYHLCAYKVSHHGSAESTTKETVELNKPTLAVFPASLRTYGSSTKPLPTRSAIEQMDSLTTTRLYTFIPQNPTKLASYYTYNYLRYYNDVILKITGGPSHPDYGENLPITIMQVKKNLDFTYPPGPPVVTVINCTKGHLW